jgi:multidrug resistance efflux pump
MAANFDASVASMQEEARNLHAMAAIFDSEVAALRSDFAEVVRDVQRYRAIERAIDTERDFDTLLNYALENWRAGMFSIALWFMTLAPREKKYGRLHCLNS